MSREKHYPNSGALERLSYKTPARTQTQGDGCADQPPPPCPSRNPNCKKALRGSDCTAVYLAAKKHKTACLHSASVCTDSVENSAPWVCSKTQVHAAETPGPLRSGSKLVGRGVAILDNHSAETSSIPCERGQVFARGVHRSRGEPSTQEICEFC